MPHAYRPDVHYPRRGPVNQALAADLTFIGTGFQSRIDFFERMDFGELDVLLGGNWRVADLAPGSRLRTYIDEGALSPDDARFDDIRYTMGRCVDNTETAELYRHARMGINLYRRESEAEYAGQGWAIGPREIEMARCHLPFLRDPRPEGDKVFSMLPTFASPEDASEQLQWWLNHDRERDRAADEALAAVADRTFENNAKRLLQALENI
jgi:hypothetical protein